ncbi:GntP family permease [Pseudonocardia nigra]|uniref:GntP family permease n=1 Tax=Pseudonocardia nigra TaxID=1921578 RepID=UPI001C5CD11A|nr:GntP family permease [Pseudonocardia nigra]
MDEVVPALGTVPLLLIAVAAVAVLLLLIIVLRLHAFVALVLVSTLTALATGIPLGEVSDILLEGFGNTLASVALLVGLGAMIGKLLEVTGGANVLADTLVNRFGEKRAPLALGIASLLFGFPIFFDAGFVVFLPIILSVAKRFGGSLLLYAMPAAGAFATMHAFVPPHPGPVGAAELLGANTGLVLIVGLLIGVPTWFVASYLFGLWVGRRIDLPVPDAFGGVEDRSEGRDGDGGGTGTGTRTALRTAPPRFSTVLVLLLLPLVLILLNTGLNTLAIEGVVDGDNSTVAALRLLGQTSIALLITAIVAMIVLGRERFSRSEVESIVNSSLGPVCAIILVTGAGGMFGGVLRASGIGGALADSLSAIGLPVIVAAFIIALCLRVAQGSATVALTTTAGLISPVVAQSGLSSLDLALVVIAIASGATALSHVNDSGFWLVGRFLGMDEKTTLKTWTVMATLIGLIGFALSFVVSLVV